jgi:hypothetical protein
MIMKAMRNTVTVLFLSIYLLMGVFLSNVSAVSDAKDNMSEEMSPYAVHRVTKPKDFKGLQQWVQYNFLADESASVYYLPETLYDLTMDDGKPAASFETWEHDHYVRNTLVNAGKILILYSISDPEFSPQTLDSEESFLGELANITAMASCDDTYKCNCVLWVRNCKAYWLPSGMTYIWEKKSKINTQEAKSGRVAVMDIYYPYGHVAYITKVSGSSISVQEANYTPCKVTSRTGTKSGMKIAGYIKH